MIIETMDDVTEAVLREMHRTLDARTKEILGALVRHLHAFAREVKLTEREFQAAVGHVNAIGQRTTASHNEAMLVAGALGLSNLVCLMNNGGDGARPTQANNLGPFWRTGSPRCEDGACIVRSPTPGPELRFQGWVRDAQGRPVAGAEVDVWHPSPVGLYENQDPAQPDHNLRGRFETDADGRFHFRSMRPAGYPVPIDGPCGEMLRAQERHPYRPAHIHFMFSKEGYKTLVTQVFADDDHAIAADVVFGVTPALSGNFERQPDGSVRLEYDFVMRPGMRRITKAPLP